jgi:hypothetical protein
MNKCILLPLHLYDYDVQGDLHKEEKIQMYKYSINQTLKASKGLKVIVICHGKEEKLFDNKQENLEIYWSKYYKEPNINGLFDKNPAQRSIVYEGLIIAKNKGYDYVIKGRADSAILNLDPILNLAIENENKYIFTQITTFIDPWLLGDCFMAGKIDKLIKLWAPSNYYDADGLIYFAKRLMEIEKENDLFRIIVNKSFFIDLAELKVVDFRFTWKSKIDWLKKEDYDINEILWGNKNNWLKSKHGQMILGDRPNILTKKIFNRSALYNFHIIRKVTVLYRKFLKLIFQSVLYKL